MLSFETKIMSSEKDEHIDDDDDEEDNFIHYKSTSTAITKEATMSSSSSSSSSLSSSLHGPLHEERNTDFTQITRLNKIHYIHGAYASSGPMFIKHSKWMSILHHLMPEAYENLMTLLNDKKIKTNSNDCTTYKTEYTELIIKWAENNPIVTAFGCMYSKSLNIIDGGNRDCRCNNNNENENNNNGSISALNKRNTQGTRIQPAIEWDVFLDPKLVRRVDIALQHLENMNNTNSWSGGLVDNKLMKAARDEVSRQLTRLIYRMVLSHGSTTQLAIEASGVARSFNFSQVVRGGKVSLGKTQSYKEKSKYIRTKCIFVHEWLTLFHEALRLGSQSDEAVNEDIASNSNFQLVSHSSSDISATAANQPMAELGSYCGFNLCFGMNEQIDVKSKTLENSIVHCTKKIATLLGEDLRVILDLKSRHVPPRVWAKVIDTLNSGNLFVEGVGSFDIEEVRAITSLVSAPVCPIMFFHSAGDLQRACHENKIFNGDTVYFNAGCLTWRKEGMCAVTPSCNDQPSFSSRPTLIDYALSESDDDTPNFQYFAYPRETFKYLVGSNSTISVLEDYQKLFNLNVGLYIQEYAIGPEEVESIIQLVNDHPSIFSLGLAWGGLNGLTCSNITGDGYASQRYLGNEWNYNWNIAVQDHEVEPVRKFCHAFLFP